MNPVNMIFQVTDTLYALTVVVRTDPWPDVEVYSFIMCHPTTFDVLNLQSGNLQNGPYQ
jgi:hypothetical protein